MAGHFYPHLVSHYLCFMFKMTFIHIFFFFSICFSLELAKQNRGHIFLKDSLVRMKRQAIPRMSRTMFDGHQQERLTHVEYVSLQDHDFLYAVGGNFGRNCFYYFYESFVYQVIKSELGA